MFNQWGMKPRSRCNQTLLEYTASVGCSQGRVERRQGGVLLALLSEFCNADVVVYD